MLRLDGTIVGIGDSRVLNDGGGHLKLSLAIGLIVTNDQSKRNFSITRHLLSN